MLVGSADPEASAAGAPVLRSLDTDELILPKAGVLQLLCEIASEPLCELLPPALHPTSPPAVGWLAYDCPDTPWGPTRLVQTRIQCRSGTRPRGFLVSAVCNNDAAGRALASRWGYRIRSGQIGFRHSYDEVSCTVSVDDEVALEIGLRNPRPLGTGDIQFVAGMHPANTPRGYRLLQCDPVHADLDPQWGDPVVGSFEPEAWGDARIEPTYPISAAACTADITLPKLRYLCLPGEMAFTGTEKV